MKSKIRVIFESFISCGKPSKVLSEPGDESSENVQRQGEEQQVMQNEPKIVKNEPKNAQVLLQGTIVKNEDEKAQELERGTFVNRKHITTNRKITISAQQAKRSRKRSPPRSKTG
ncbi:hypothetical protein MTR67_016891 [Solanum verrucosum]|uniref:Uncharacterized protein n=1 Tax=Solanum verrucosum TaxID=315347 RepID=A0AAF0QHN8_SOLVR|nr:hypothetical protein MTR67_016891 [Solanum verrucosum]